MLEAIKDIINPDVILNICTGEKILTVKEDHQDSKIKKLHIHGIPEDAFAFTLDYQPQKDKKCFQQLSCYLNKENQEGINKSCDLVLFLPSSFQILICDLKSDRIKKEDCDQQLLNSELYIRYLLSMLQEYYDVDTGKIKFKRVIITTKPNPNKNSVYPPNKKKSETFNLVSVSPIHDEAFVYLRQLLE
jgi:hypothetical protein